MSERLLAVLLQQALLFSVGVVLVAALRPAQEPLRVVLQATGTTEAVAMPVLPAPPASHATTWLALWFAGAAAVVFVQGLRQRQLARQGAQLPAGSSPALVGLLRPRIALPVDFEQRFSPAERELILAHEQVHQARGDNAWNLLACALTALHWWNPLAWWAARRLRADQELACDAAVLATRPGALADYTRALLAAHDLTHHGAPLASRWGTAHPLVERIAMLNRPLPLNRRRALLLAAGVTAISTLAYAAEGPTPAAAGTGYLKMQVKVERSRGGEKTSIETHVIGRDGERLKLGFNAIGTDTPNWTTEPLWIHLQPQKQGESALVKTQIELGEPAIEIGHPSVMVALGTKARIEITRPESGEKLALELTPTLAPADFKPPKNTF